MLSIDQITDLIESNSDYSAKFFIWQMDENNTDTEQFYIDEIESDLDERVVALMLHTGDYYDDCQSAIVQDAWYVLTDDEADKKCEDYAEESLYELLYGQPDIIKQYFDSDSYISDYIDTGRGEMLSSADGYEHEVTVNGTTYYLYEQ